MTSNAGLGERACQLVRDRDDLFCCDLPCKRLGNVGRILVTGATGYIGGRLAPELLARGYDVRVVVRGESPDVARRWPGAEIAVADARDLGQVRLALEGVDTAYYLIHSLALGPERFAEADIKAARAFRQAAEDAGVRRIIYLGGLGDSTTALSGHLRSRMDVASELQRGSVPVTVLRAAVIIGSGSASFEIVRHLVRRLPVMGIPRWARNRCQPIGVRDVIRYLVGVLEVSDTAGQSFDIGGRDVLTYQQMLRLVAQIHNRGVWMVPLPFSLIGPFSYVASLITPVPDAITHCLFDSLRNEVVCGDDRIRAYLPFEPQGFKEAVVRAMTREQQDQVYTRWSDAYPPAHELAMKLRELPEPARYSVAYVLATDRAAEPLFQAICRVGGRAGWFNNNWMWRLRGLFDRILGGVGSARGRRCRSRLHIDDVIDFWRVEDLVPSRRLLLRAEMKLPGRAWLEFSIVPVGDRHSLGVKAYFDTASLFGRLYWQVFRPFHHLIFKDLIRQIERRSEECAS